MRLRFRLQKKLNIETAEHRFRVGDVEAVISSFDKERPIKDSYWLVINARGFATADDARAYGDALRLAVELASIATRLGVDTGVDAVTFGVGQDVREVLLQQGGILLRDNVHGVDVFEDDSRVCILSGEATGEVLAAHEPFLPYTADLFNAMKPLSQNAHNVIILLNSALMLTEPIGKIVFAVSAVEMIGQDLDWSASQRRVLVHLAALAQQHSELQADERTEVVAAIEKLHRISLRQGVFRLLDTLSLSHLRKPWDKLYAKRSEVIHAIAPQRAANYDELANETVTLCGYILLKAIAAEFPLAGQFAERYFQPPL